jgi:predicted membrane-bound spermidine synthase
VRHAAFLAAGLLATAAQVLLLRELVVDVAGDEAAIGVGLAAWLAGIAAGASAARRRDDARAPSDASAGLAVLAVLPLAAIVYGRWLRLALAPGAGELPGLGLALVLSLATLAPPGLAVGWTFTALAASASRLWDAGEGIARLYVAESLGSLAGGAAVALLAGAWVAPLRLAACCAVAAAVLALAASRGGLLGRPWTHGAVAALGLATAALAPALDAASERARFAGTAPGLHLRAWSDTPYEHLALGGDQVLHLYASGQYTGSFPDPWGAGSLGHLLALLAPHPRSVLLVGGLERGIVPVLLQHPVRRLVILEPDRAALEFLLAWLPEADRAALRDPRVSVVHDDPRRFVGGGRPGGLFDLVLLLGGEPATLLRARLATAEFLRDLAARVAPDGAIVVSVRTAPLALAGRTEALAGSLVRTLQEAAPVVRATPGPDALLVAGHDPAAVTLDPAVLESRWRERRVASPSFDPAVLPALLDRGRVAASEAALLDAAARQETSRDDRPVSFLHALARRQQTTAGAWGGLVSAAALVPRPVLVLAAFLPSLVILARQRGAHDRAGRRAKVAASHAVAVVGAAGMGWWLLLLFSFQTHAGALYGWLGALAAIFMLGLAAGAVLSPRAALGAGERAVSALPGAVRALRLSLGAAAVFAATLPWTLPAAARASTAGTLPALAAHAALLLAAGVVTGGLFPIAAEVRLAAGDGAGEAAGRLETADHVGAAAAALLGAVLYLPLLGASGSVWLLAALVAAALATTLSGPLTREEGSSS